MSSLPLPMVGLVPPSKEVQAAPKQHSNALQSLDLDELICECLRQARLTHGQACAYIGNGKGKAYDQSQWTTARETGNLPVGRMLASLPEEFWVPFIARLADAAGLRVAHHDLRTVAIRETAVALRALATCMEMTA